VTGCRPSQGCARGRTPLAPDGPAHHNDRPALSWCHEPSRAARAPRRRGSATRARTQRGPLPPAHPGPQLESVASRQMQSPSCDAPIESSPLSDGAGEPRVEAIAVAQAFHHLELEPLPTTTEAARALEDAAGLVFLAGGEQRHAELRKRRCRGTELAR